MKTKIPWHTPILEIIDLLETGLMCDDSLRSDDYDDMEIESIISKFGVNNH